MNSFSLDPELIHRRASILRSIRNFFYERKVLEVEVPVVGAYSVTDPYLDALSVDMDGQEHFLQTSPEYFLKRLLAGGSGDLYSLGKAFRRDERGRIHRPEFTMLEWYRLDFDDLQLMQELAQLLSVLHPGIDPEYCSYRDLFVDACGIDPHAATASQLRGVAVRALDIHWPDEDKNLWLDLLFTHIVEPTLHKRCVFVYDYPASQCALARLAQDDRGVLVAKRFELYWQGLELANGYWELRDVNEQRGRFEADNQRRRAEGKVERQIDPLFMQAMEVGLPNCAGVALGIDRLIMCLLQLGSIHEQHLQLQP
ncbi:MAG: lysyl-tRNA synthetase class 2 [Flavobacteriales bacterium]|jgi:lysyl-tRNA synthetase class 2